MACHDVATRRRVSCSWPRVASFDLDTCVGEAIAIVQGNLDSQGELTVTKIIKGDVDSTRRIELYMGDGEFRSLQKVMGNDGPLEVLTFLKEKADDDSWRPVLPYAGIVGFKDQAVFLVVNDIRTSHLGKDEAFTKTSFFQALDVSVKANDERLRLAALPRSVERTKLLAGFALQHGQVDDAQDRFHHQAQYQLQEVARALNKPDEAEQAAFLQALREAKTTREQVILLNLAKWMTLKSEAVNVIALFLPRMNSPAVREAAMNALHRIDAYKAVDYLIPYLTPDDPQLATVLQNFGSSSYLPQDQLLNIHAVDALIKLAQSMPGPDEIPIDHGYVSGAISGQLCHYLHPRLLPILYARAIYGEGPSSAQVFSNFRSAVDLKYPPEDKANWEAWFKKAQSLLDGTFDLQTAEGRALWVERYTQADPATQDILMRLWFFEPWINEVALIDLAAQNEVAKTVLAELWKHDRLSNDAMRSIVERFTTFRLVNEIPDWPSADKHSYSVRIHSVSSFPFPQNALIDGRIRLWFNDDTSDGDLANWKNGSLASNREGVDNKTASKGGSFSVPPQARATI